MAWLLIPILVTGCWLVSWCYLKISQDPREPPAIPHPIPYVGHVVQLLRYGTKYYGMMRSVSASIVHERLVLRVG